ncbi:hypothetical protein T484DRAFT_1818697 [Baffinella frigidus]|nr:hypothetical protein T484DRAFT_1818697 [Cryptophyta sp. CCMP2293]
MSYSSGCDWNSSDEDDGTPDLPLGDEIKRGEIEVVRRALAEGKLDANAQDQTEDLGFCTLLHWTAGQEPFTSHHRGIIDLLLKHGANPNKIWTKETFLGGHRHLRPVDLTDCAATTLLLHESAAHQPIGSMDKTQLACALLSASWLGAEDKCRELVAAGADARSREAGTTALREAMHRPNGTPVISYLLDECGVKLDAGLISTAAANGNLAALRMLLDRGVEAATLDEEFALPCKWAGTDASVRKQVTKMLCDAYLREVPEMRSAEMQARVFLACVEHGDVEAVAALSKILPFPTPALPTAVNYGQPEVLTFLLENGALATYDAGKLERVHESKTLKGTFWGSCRNEPPDELVRRLQAQLSAWVDGTAVPPVASLSALSLA